MDMAIVIMVMKTVYSRMRIAEKQSYCILLYLQKLKRIFDLTSLRANIFSQTPPTGCNVDLSAKL